MFNSLACINTKFSLFPSHSYKLLCNDSKRPKGMGITRAAFITLATLCSFHNHQLWSILNKAECDLRVDILITPHKNNSLSNISGHQTRCCSELLKTRRGSKEHHCCLARETRQWPPYQGGLFFRDKSLDSSWSELAWRNNKQLNMYETNRRNGSLLRQCSIASFISRLHRLCYLSLYLVQCDY